MEMNPADIKRLKEEFVSNFNGTTAWEPSVTDASVCAGVLLRNLLVPWLYGATCNIPFSLKFLLDFVTVVLPTILCITVLADHTITALIVLLCICIGIITSARTLAEADMKRKKLHAWTINDILNFDMGGRRPFIMYVRSGLLVGTSIMILAVDFVIQPRRFCKTETYGCGAMDLGVGFFILSNAIVSPEARQKYRVARDFSGKLRSVWKAMISSSPLIILGLARLISVKGTGYQEHVSEYGVHWNFFFTLVAVKVLSTAVLCVASVDYCWMLSFLVSVGYQYLLSTQGLSAYILQSGHRDNLLDANREGIFSSLGYLSIYFAGVPLGKYLLKQRSKVQDWLQVAGCLVMVEVLLGLVYWWSDSNIEATSRRLANWSYVVWTLASYLSVVVLFLLVDIVCSVCQGTGILVRPPSSQGAPEKTSETMFCLVEAISRNQLVFFLIANLLTGAVNFSMHTIFASPEVALAVLVGYQFVLCLITALLHYHNITLKFW